MTIEIQTTETIEIRAQEEMAALKIELFGIP